MKTLLGYARTALCYASIVAACLFLAVTGISADDKKADEKKADDKKAPAAGKEGARAEAPAQNNAKGAPAPAAKANVVVVPNPVGQQMPAQSPGNNNDDQYSEGITLSTDRNIKKILEAAQELIEEAAKTIPGARLPACCSRCST